MSKLVDITGLKVERWTVLKYVGKAKWLCRCDCGTEKIVNGYNLRHEKTRSCGCLRKETATIIGSRKGNIKDLTGQRFGRLTVLEVHDITNRGAHWKCLCDCGNTHIVQSGHLSFGSIKSCGCGHGNHKHDRSGERLWNIWYGMKYRCENSNHDGYRRYGGRGIEVCNEWQDYEVFREWALINGYVGGLTIDRINNDGNYEPSNCQWLTRIENIKKGAN